MHHRLITLFAVIGAVFCSGRSYAQVSSSAFDPNCYQPLIGTPGVVDTIYGSYNNEQLGSFVKNIWQEKDQSYGSIIIDSGADAYYGRSVHKLYQSGPNFNLHKLQAKDTFNLGYHVKPNNLVRRGHFRSMQYMDALFADKENFMFVPRIYWADDQGKYDSTRYTELRSPITGSYGISYNQIQPYCTHLATDSLDDIIFGVNLNYHSTSLDSTFFLYFKSGSNLINHEKQVYADSIAYLDTFYVSTRNFTQGDFRGTGKEDLIASNGAGNIFFYKNDPPFSLQKFTSAMKHDTLMAFWQNPKGNSGFNENQLVMHAFNKPSGDSSFDFLPVNGNVQEVHIYKGGPDFGSHRLQEDQADFIIHHPSYLDSKWNSISVGGSAINCGKMAGTNNNVLYRIGGDIGAGFYGYHFFYVLGDALDDKIDMFLTMDGFGAGGGGFDTLIADGDKYQDIIIGIPDHRSDADHNKGKDEVGTAWVIHGSNKIPVHLNEVYAKDQRKAVNDATGHIFAYPNPCDRLTTLAFDNCTSSVMKVEVCTLIGTIVKRDETPAVDGLQAYAVDLSELPSGMYIIRLTCAALGWTGSVNVIKTGAAQVLQHFDLKKMVGR